MQTGQVDPFSQIETWWGETLTRELVERILSSPSEHIYEFDDYIREASPAPIPETEYGKLRPLAAKSIMDEIESDEPFRYLKSAVNLSLYTHEVLVEDPLRYIYKGNRVNRYSLESALIGLLNLKELHRQGVVTFARIDERLFHPSRTHLFTQYEEEWDHDPENEELIRLMLEMEDRRQGIEIGFSQLIFHLKSEIGRRIGASAETPGAFNHLVRTDDELVFYRIAMKRAARQLIDDRELRLRYLAGIELPKISAKATSIVSLRKSADEFAQWRSALSTAMKEMDTLSVDDARWAETAKDLFCDNLEPIRSKMEKSVRESSALSAMTKGMTSFSFSGVGSLTGMAAGGNFTTSFAAAAAGKAAEIGVEYLKSLRKRRSSKAVLDLIVSFR